MKLTYLGHSCFMLEVGGKRLLFDPFITPNALATEAGVNIDEWQPDYILVSHGHEDHTADLLTIAKSSGATVVSNWEICSYASKHGVSLTHPMNIGGCWNFDFGKVKMVYAAHSSSLPDGSYGGTASGFIIEADGKCMYYAGDTALHTDMQLLGEFHAIDIALLPIGDNFTMGYADACRAADFVGAKQVVAMHFDTFGFIKINHDQVSKYFTEHSKHLTIPKIMQTITI